MNELKYLVEESSDEVWLFADLFASLLMTIVLLVNAHTAVTNPKNVSDRGESKDQTRLVYLIDENNVAFDSSSSSSISIIDAVKELKQSKAHAELIASAKNNGKELFIVFGQLEDAGINYSFALNNQTGEEL